MIYEEEFCGCCGACVAVCPRQVLELEENHLKISQGCQDCGNCQIVCPLGALIEEDNK